jgi:hypothetical protein
MVLKVSDGIVSQLKVPGPASEQEIMNAESELGVQFPPEYREFLAKFGAALGPGYEIAGLAHQVPEEDSVWDNVVSATRALRDKHGKIGNYDDLIAISGDGMDLTFYLRTKGNNPGSVIALGPGVEKEIAANLSEFIARIHGGELNIYE